MLCSVRVYKYQSHRYACRRRRRRSWLALRLRSKTPKLRGILRFFSRCEILSSWDCTVIMCWRQGVSPDNLGNGRVPESVTFYDTDICTGRSTIYDSQGGCGGVTQAGIPVWPEDHRRNLLSLGIGQGSWGIGRCQGSGRRAPGGDLKPSGDAYVALAGGLRSIEPAGRDARSGIFGPAANSGNRALAGRT